MVMSGSPPAARKPKFAPRTRAEQAAIDRHKDDLWKEMLAITRRYDADAEAPATPDRRTQQDDAETFQYFAAKLRALEQADHPTRLRAVGLPMLRTQLERLQRHMSRLWDAAEALLATQHRSGAPRAVRRWHRDLAARLLTRFARLEDREERPRMSLIARLEAQAERDEVTAEDDE